MTPFAMFLLLELFTVVCTTVGHYSPMWGMSYVVGSIASVAVAVWYGSQE